MGEEKPGDVYSYIEETYKEAWSSHKTGWDITNKLGITHANRWEQFEGYYRYNCAAYSGSYPATAEIYEEMMKQKQERLDLWNEIHENTANRVDLYKNNAAVQQTWQEAIDYTNSQVSDSAALEAFREMGMDVMLLDQNQVQKDIEAALEASKEGQKEASIEDAKAALEAKVKREGGIEYLVRGAPLQCLYGTHMRYLDMLETHGVYLNEKPLIHQKDCELNINIFPFGICNSPTCTLTERDSIMRGAEVDIYGNYLNAKDEQILTGFLCKPEIIDRQWNNTHSETKIADNATAETKDPSECDCYDAVTTGSYLLCKQGGLIMATTSGQFDYSAYTAAFMNYPFNDFGSKAFMNWCEKENICPYLPGNKKYDDWHQKNIHAVMEGDYKKKEAKAAYEAYLSGAYQQGLDTMDSDAQKRVEKMLNQYLESGLLNEKEADKIRDKYSGLRIDYGHNEQKNTAPASPESPEFYQYYQEEIESYNEEIKRLREELMGMSDHDSKLTETALDMRKATEGKNETYNRYLKELNFYEGHLSEENKKQAQSVDDAYHRSAY